MRTVYCSTAGQLSYLGEISVPGTQWSSFATTSSTGKKHKSYIFLFFLFKHILFSPYIHKTKHFKLQSYKIMVKKGWATKFLNLITALPGSSFFTTGSTETNPIRINVQGVRAVQ